MSDGGEKVLTCARAAVFLIYSACMLLEGLSEDAVAQTLKQVAY